MTHHELKTENPWFMKLWDRKKTAELRKNDRHFKPGDTVVLRHWCRTKGYSPMSIEATISDITQNEGAFDGLKDGWVMLSLSELVNYIVQ